ncbi:MAG: Tex family protein [Desulfovibrio sp.]|nr:Tex family protein [Desulfovibrio sp.]
MTTDHSQRMAQELSLPPNRVRAVLDLLEQGATIPFIARYRKEATGSMDEVAVMAIRDRHEQLQELDKRRHAILKSLEERDLLSDELRRAVHAAPDLAALEDVYLPHRPKRRTRATMARERGLEPLARCIFQQENGDLRQKAKEYVRPEADKDQRVPDVDAALAGARDIVAEWVSEDVRVRKALRTLFQKRARLRTALARGKSETDTECAKFRDYFEYEEPLPRIPSHRALAALRGEAEGVLSLSLRPRDQEAVDLLQRGMVKKRNSAAQELQTALTDAWKRLLAPSLENELRKQLKERADQQAIAVFAANLRELLLAAPLGPHPVLALDPGFRTGAKVAVLGAQGALLEHTTIYPTKGREDARRAAETLRSLVRKYPVRAVAIGNGTASRETESFVRGLDLHARPRADADTPRPVEVVMVNEAGASVYSASETARREFPNLDLTVRGAVSIGRRLMDPLAELVKIDPKSIGVGQYQHDVDQAALRRALDEVVQSCVSAVGVDLNTASPELLQAVPGIGPKVAAAIVARREQEGPFTTRRQLRKVKGLGPKAFEQSAGFLRVRGGIEPLDAGAVHPERYALVRRMAQSLDCSVEQLMNSDEQRKKLNIEQFVGDDVGLPTLRDILAELEKPGRDPRARFEAFAFADVHEPADLEPGMRLPGIVTNVTAFGAFIDVGVHQDGLVHVSQLADRFVRDPAEVVRAGQQVEVRVLEVDPARKRISLSMKGLDS